MKHNPIIFAADFPSIWETEKFVKPIISKIGMIKVGLQLFISEGSETFFNFPVPIMLDLKLHDIPETVFKAVKEAASFPQVRFLTVHCLGGAEMMKAAVEATQGTSCEILGITVLTSLGRTELRQLQLPEYSEYYVKSLVSLGMECGVKGFVCSPLEVKMVREFAPKTTLVVPGIRMEAGDSHKRMGTPEGTLEAGTDYIVLGRMLRNAQNPGKVLEEILNGYVSRGSV